MVYFHEKRRMLFVKRLHNSHDAAFQLNRYVAVFLYDTQTKKIFNLGKIDDIYDDIQIYRFILKIKNKNKNKR